METRKHVEKIELSVPAEQVFKALYTPSAIRSWWGAFSAIVVPRLGGVWAVSWGKEEDDPDFIGTAKITSFDPPSRFAIAYDEYYGKTDKLPFDAQFTVDFSIEDKGEKSCLCVAQEGFPVDTAADEFYSSCKTGWTATLEALKTYLQEKR